MKWLEIGICTPIHNKDQWMVSLNDGYEKALAKLDLFSHCILFFLRSDQLDTAVLNILAVDQKTGRLTLESVGQSDAVPVTDTGQLVDIKPYFPNEEVIKEAKEPKERFALNYTGDSIGTYELRGNRPVIQIEKHRLKGADLAAMFKAGDILRVLWYFHRFDTDRFRRNRMCTPPYNGAPKTGIFATRSPVRPNPLGSTTVRVERVDGVAGCLEIAGFDGFADTQILQVMFYQPRRDRVAGATLPPWVAHWTPYKTFESPKEIDSTLTNGGDDDGEKGDGVFFSELAADAGEDDGGTSEIHIHNARIHNLKNISLTIPKAAITLITGVSGSGKSSLAFDTLFAESQRQFMDLVLSNRMMNDTFNDTGVDRISGLQPAIAVEQRSLGANPRSTVGSVTRIADMMKLLFATLGERVCAGCHSPVDDTNVCAQCGRILFDRAPQMFSHNHPDFMCPVCKGLGVELQIDKNLIVTHPEKSLLDSASPLYGDLRKHRKKPNANWMRGEILALAADLGVDLELPFNRLPKSFQEQFFNGSNGREVSLRYQNAKGRSGVITRPAEGAIHLIARLAHDAKSERSMENVKRFMAKKTCSRCQGERLREEGRLVHIRGHRYPEVMNRSIDRLVSWCHRIYGELSKSDREKGRKLLSKILFRLRRVQDVGLSYITLDRSIPSLSGGEAQRLKLATQFGTGLSDILYIMDEPSRGLHPRDYRFLMDAIVDLKKHGNTVVLVEHKKRFGAIADKHIEMGPKAGRYGGEVIAGEVGDAVLERFTVEETIEDFDKLDIQASPESSDATDGFIEIRGAATHNLKEVTVRLPKEKITAVIGVSGSGKSSLISKTLYPRVLAALGKQVEEKGRAKAIVGIDAFKDVNYVSQKAIGSNARSNPATYTGLFDLIRKCYGSLPDAAARKLGKEHFSFNSKKGQCENCAGLGEVAVNMHYMDDIYIPCSACQGKRYTKEVLAVKRNGYSIGDILETEISDLPALFESEKEIVGMLTLLEKVGLGYLKLGQSAASLSGGEAQRIKLAKELYRTDCKNVLYILDEPTAGLHDEDVKRIIAVLRELQVKGATIIVIEHNLRLIESCDYLVEMGPTGGDSGGHVMRMGVQQR